MQQFQQRNTLNKVIGSYDLGDRAISVPAELRKRFKDAQKCHRVAVLLSEEHIKPQKAANVVGLPRVRVYQIQRDLNVNGLNSRYLSTMLKHQASDLGV